MSGSALGADEWISSGFDTWLKVSSSSHVLEQFEGAKLKLLGSNFRSCLSEQTHKNKNKHHVVIKAILFDLYASQAFTNDEAYSKPTYHDQRCRTLPPPTS